MKARELNLPKRVLGKTGILVSVLGLGTVKFGRNQKVHYPHPFALPSEAEAERLLALAQDHGMNLLDTAPAYGESEERLGRLLVGQRQAWILSSKVGEEFIGGESFFDFSKPAICKSIERSLKRLKTDYLDVVFVHSNGEDVKLIQEEAVFETLAELKKSGKIRAYGMSTKTIEGGLLAVEASDVVMVTYNPQQLAEQPVLLHAHQQGKGVFIKKALASGHLLQRKEEADPVKAAFDFIFREPGVSTVILGTLNPEHLEQNVACVKALLN
jgi:aryl-alcohol dehydrogenase-like predicted oxidoreductase